MTNIDSRSMANNGHERIVRMRELAGRLALSSSHLYALIKAGKFPKPVELVPGGRSKGWPEQELSAWLRSRIELRDATCENPGKYIGDKPADTATPTQSVTGDRS
jgi:prophage regulatory protein